MEIWLRGCFEWFDHHVKMQMMAAEHRGGTRVVDKL